MNNTLLMPHIFNQEEDAILISLWISMYSCMHAVSVIFLQAIQVFLCCCIPMSVKGCTNSRTRITTSPLVQSFFLLPDFSFFFLCCYVTPGQVTNQACFNCISISSHPCCDSPQLRWIKQMHSDQVNSYHVVSGKRVRVWLPSRVMDFHSQYID